MARLEPRHPIPFSQFRIVALLASPLHRLERHRRGAGYGDGLDLVPVREVGMSAYELMLSESQERMLMVQSLIPHGQPVKFLTMIRFHADWPGDRDRQVVCSRMAA